jgi:predicted 2-oxoglutarate/Fe(II)-dependent dioxygenase YbiX
MSEDLKIHYLKVENYFNEQELEEIWRELDHLNRPGVFESGSGRLGAAYDQETGSPLKVSSGLWIHEVYKHPKFSAIHKHMGKLFNGYTSEYASLDYSNYAALLTEASSQLINYYECEDHYKPHRDNAVATALHWLWKEPKKFEGGELTFTHTGETIPLTNNTMIIFPSYAMHEVSTVWMEPLDCNKGLGRYCLSTFLFNSLKLDE